MSSRFLLPFLGSLEITGQGKIRTPLDLELFAAEDTEDIAFSCRAGGPVADLRNLPGSWPVPTSITKASSAQL